MPQGRFVVSPRNNWGGQECSARKDHVRLYFRNGIPMEEKVFGLSVNQVMAYAAVANVLLVVVLTAINVYYAWYSKRQAEAAGPGRRVEPAGGDR
jgi:hypothetical protein